jgi:hypothetical protein
MKPKLNLSEKFLNEFIAGRAELADVDEWVDEFHRGGVKMPLYQYLGLSWDEFELFCLDGTNWLNKILEKRKNANQNSC